MADHGLTKIGSNVETIQYAITAFAIMAAVGDTVVTATTVDTDVMAVATIEMAPLCLAAWPRELSSEARSRNSHARVKSDGYCSQRYKSYDPASGTYLGYDGQRHSCP